MFEPFKEFLLHKGSIKHQYLPFYLKWVAECYHFLNRTIQELLGHRNLQTTMVYTHVAPKTYWGCGVLSISNHSEPVHCKASDSHYPAEMDPVGQPPPLFPLYPKFLWDSIPWKMKIFRTVSFSAVGLGLLFLLD
mgnify:CR=1 FL=1